MNIKDREAYIEKMGKPWSSLAASFRASRDRSLKGFSGHEYEDSIAKGLNKHYRELLKTIVRVSRKKPH